MKVKKIAKPTSGKTKAAMPMKSGRAAARKDVFGPNHDLIVEVTNSQKLYRVREEALEDLVKFVFNAENTKAARLSIALLNDEEVHRLNRQFLGHDYPTDVITFPLSDPGEPIVGEIVLSTETRLRKRPNMAGL